GDADGGTDDEGAGALMPQTELGPADGAAEALDDDDGGVGQVLRMLAVDKAPDGLAPGGETALQPDDPLHGASDLDGGAEAEIDPGGQVDGLRPGVDGLLQGGAGVGGSGGVGTEVEEVGPVLRGIAPGDFGRLLDGEMGDLSGAGEAAVG